MQYRKKDCVHLGNLKGLYARELLKNLPEEYKDKVFYDNFYKINDKTEIIDIFNSKAVEGVVHAAAAREPRIVSMYAKIKDHEDVKKYFEELKLENLGLPAQKLEYLLHIQ